MLIKTSQNAVLRRKHINREASFNTTPELLFLGAKTGPLHFVCVTSVIIRVPFSLMGHTFYFLVHLFFTVMPIFCDLGKETSSCFGSDEDFGQLLTYK